MRFAIFIIFFQLIILLAHFVVYKFGISTYATLEKNKILFGSFLAIMSVSFSLSMFFTRFNQNFLSSAVYTGSSFWLGFLFWLFLVVVLFSLAGFIAGFHNFYFKIAFFVSFISIVLLNVYGLLNGFYPKVEKINISIENLPDSWNGKRALFFADTHYGNLHTEKSAKRLAKLINENKPEIVFISGDFFDGPMKDFDIFTSEFANLKIPKGIYFVNGNHEDYAGKEKTNKSLIQNGFNIIDQQIVVLDGLQIIGIPYTTSSDSEIDKESTKNVFTMNQFDPSLPSVVLKHVPVGVESLLEFKPDFVFFGHTHKGQMWPFSILVKKIYKEHYYGLIQKDSTLFYTTSGVGGWGPPQRIGTKSEVLEVRFLKNE